jgi:hypothetical protein
MGPGPVTPSVFARRGGDLGLCIAAGRGRGSSVGCEPSIRAVRAGLRRLPYGPYSARAHARVFERDVAELHRRFPHPWHDEGARLGPHRRGADRARRISDRPKARRRGADGGPCASPSPPLSLDGPSFTGWDANVENWRFQPDPGPSDLFRLELKWAFGVPGAILMFAQPTVAAGRVFIGGQNGHVYALDMKTECYYWDYLAIGGVRTAITVARVGGRIVAFFGDRRGHAYSVDAASGETLWKVMPDDEASASTTGAPVLFENRLYVPIANGDGDGSGDPAYECCQGRGAVVALDAATGDVVWRTYTTAKAEPQGKNAVGTQLYSPSGASVWSAPTIDAKRRVLYVGTGDNHSAPATDTSDAVLALNLDDGCLVETASRRRHLERRLRLRRPRQLPRTARTGSGYRLIGQPDLARCGKARARRRPEIRHGLGARPR